MQPKKVKRVGAIGGGQLAQMMAVAARKLGIEFVVQTPHSSDPAVAIAASTVLADIDDPAATAKLAAYCDVTTFENEFVNLAPLVSLEKQGFCFRPGLRVLAHLLDKYDQLCYLEDLGLRVPDFTVLEAIAAGGSPAERATPVSFDSLSYPLVLKARRHGYDGQGTFVVKDRQDLESAWSHLDRAPVLLEKFIPFVKELAIVAARSVEGEVALYPVVETQQEGNVCRRVFVPATIAGEVKDEVEAIARTILNSLQAVGVFGIELFLTDTGQVLVNEISPRTHNSGHFTIDACETSQFEQHLRAICGLPLGDSAMKSGGAVMVNLLGHEGDREDYGEKQRQIAALPQTFVHWYGKEPRPGRKLGHVTVLLDRSSIEEAETAAGNVEAIWYD